ncbi:hypothetical protein LBG_04545 [Stenotrophomonas maltophilia]|nr:hypothetical protein EGY09_14725 [Stenotrophomonas maltophilia]QBL43881.1 hypothetical protein LBG_04545 [Stenotrophomonas maltophilia]
MNLYRDRICRIEIEKHPRVAWIYCRSQNSVEGGVGPVAGVSAAWMPRPSPQGWVYGVSRKRIHPAIPQDASFCFGCCLGLKPLQVQGRRPCRTTLTPQRARPAVAPAWYRAAARRSSSRSR